MLKGTFAVCSQGILGLITSAGPVEVTYPDGNKGEAWTGIALSGPNVGAPWSSRRPMVVGFAEELLAKAGRYVNVPDKKGGAGA
jgi:hypothetical protein